jgi:preprotein translocase subunit SecE
VSDTTTATSGSGKSGGKSEPGFFGRIGRYYRQVVAELRKVVWPTRQQLITYTGVVLVFVLIMMAIVAAEDALFGRIAIEVFGN